MIKFASLAALGLALTGAPAVKAETINMNYEVRVSGLRALEINYGADLAEDGYRARASVDTRGLVSMFAGYELKMNASGQFRNGRAMPASYNSVAERKNKKARLELSWSHDDFPEQHQPSDNDLPIRQDIDSALAKGIGDPLTAVLRLGALSDGRPCSGSERVFSGRDVYDLRFSFEKEVDLGKSAPGVYHGAAYQCRMLYVPVAGRAARKFKRSGKKPPAFKVWLAAVPSQSLGSEILVPVAASGKLEGRNFEAYATKAVIAGKPLKAAAKESD